MADAPPRPPDPAARVDAWLNGAWALAALAAAAEGAPLSREQGRLLAAAGCAEPDGDGWRLLPAYRDVLAGSAGPSAFPRRVARQLSQAADAALGEQDRAEEDDAALLAEGTASGRRMADFLDLLEERVAGFGDLLGRDGLRFLDAGTGIGAIAAAVLERVPGSRAVGLDVQPRALRLAERHLSGRGLRDRVELRLLDVAELSEPGAYDLAWLPLAALPPDAVARALPRVREALRPRAWLLTATVLRDDPGDAPDGGMRDAVVRWRMSRSRITPWGPREAARELAAAGYRDVRRVAASEPALTLLVARTP
ncbi:cyclopropane-fatty-acyl-phospholipid synthase family protein [Nocardiopsis sp. RV163]|uniref:SAM-dependent methyltransferase n=1 Tax=Nocardiopsis sp. RV163 TaxID=1661388 RepID=UPI00064C2C43|nr:class I SAM-dependent methyltransferase [Nocardiopsis sp. RV163]